MMDSPFFSSHWSSPSRPRPRYYSPSARADPIRPPAAVPSPPPKVVSIPVHFVGSERSRSDAALRIQSAFRGFLVRRSVRRIAAVRREVDEVERRISTPEAAELMRRDEKERLKVSETLMSLLFRLDSVRGVDAGVRECRKAVIRRTIALQERVDAIVAGGSSKEADVEGGDVAERESAEADDCSSGVAPPSGTTEAVVPRLEGESEPKMADADHSADADSESYRTEETQAEREAAPESDVAEHSAEADAEMEQQAADEVGKEACEPETEMAANEDEITADNYTIQSTHERVEDAVATGTESSTDSSANPQSPIGGIDKHASPKEAAATESQKPDEDGESGGRGSEERGNRRSKELLERMVEDNEKMMGLLAELFEKNERQTRLLSSLAQRVEQLERAFVCEKLRRKRRQAAGRGDAMDCSATSPDPKKCGKR
ncbi:hypothetical protein BT93_H3319 [Corymbia citriodora subsp. variegata]|nr:hypothetical protein BT93_H3319 [Corymbia citriodora subsp. variegata]